jgi:mono/diheme cytochrome c family protein
MMTNPKSFIAAAALALLVLLIAACAGANSPNNMPQTLTPIPTLASQGQITLVPAQGAGQPGGITAASGPGVGDPAAGVPIFENKCTGCHGLEAEGISGPPLRNSSYIQSSSIQDIYNTISNGRPGTTMPGWLQVKGGPLVSADINNVVAYLKKLQGVADIPRSTEIPTPTEAPVTPEPTAIGTPEPARPSGEGGAGEGAAMTGDPVRGVSLFGLYCAYCHGPQGALGVPNPDSDDGSVPALNPIDPSLINTDLKVYAENIDLFIEHGSAPSGPNPYIKMPAFGDLKLINSQQIADLIAYVILLNPAQ